MFFEALNAEEEAFVPELASDNLGLILRSAINELDWYRYNLRRQDNATFEQEEQYYLMRLGVTRLIKLSLESRRSFDVPTVTFRRAKEITLPVLEIVSGLGVIEHGRRVAQTVLAGLCRIECVDTRNFLITLPPNIPDDDYYERVVEAHYQREARRRFFEILQSEFGKKLDGDIDRLLSSLVYPFATHYIGYDADILLDEYFFGIAYAHLQTLEGFDTFHYAAKFGEVSFQKYKLALTFLLSIFMRHERFAEALVAKHPTVKLENVLTISSESAGLVESMRDAINHFGPAFVNFDEVSLGESHRIFQILSISRDNTKLLDRPSSPLPLLVQSSDHDCIRCLVGVDENSMQFLLDSLRHHFPADYDRQQQSREKSMQVALARILNGAFLDLEYRENIKVKVHGQLVTDIDLVVVEITTGTVLLCQLKHQEMYGSDVYSKYVRTTRLKEQASRWLTSIDGWIEAVGQSRVRASLRIGNSVPPLLIYRVVVARHYCHSLGGLAHSNYIAFATALQFFNSVELVKRERDQ